MNVKFGGEEHEAAIAKVLKAAHAAKKTAAIFCKCFPVLTRSATVQTPSTAGVTPRPQLAPQLAR